MRFGLFSLLTQRHMIMGDAETCAEQLTVELRQLQARHVSCSMALPDTPQDRMLRSMVVFGRDVMRRIDRAGGGFARVA
jgi:hypothetical protein